MIHSNIFKNLLVGIRINRYISINIKHCIFILIKKCYIKAGIDISIHRIDALYYFLVYIKNLSTNALLSTY